MHMQLEDTWMAHFRAIVDHEAAQGRSLRDGYRSVATKLAKSEECIYQLYKQKPKADGSPRVITLEFSKLLARHYAEGRPTDWINNPPVEHANQLRQSGPSSADSAAVQAIATWPFKNVTYRRFMALPREAQRDIDGYLEGLVTTWERKTTSNSSGKRQA